MISISPTSSRSAEYSRFYAGALSGHVSENSPPGTAYSIHSPGLAFLILPAYAAGGPSRARSSLLAALAALAGVLVHRVVRAAIDERTAAITWALFAFTPPRADLRGHALPGDAGPGRHRLLPVDRARAAGLARRAGRGRDGGGAGLAAFEVRSPGRAGTRLHAAAALRRARAGGGGGAVRAMAAGVLAYFHALYGHASLFAAIGPADLDLQRLPRHRRRALLRSPVRPLRHRPRVADGAAGSGAALQGAHRRRDPRARAGLGPDRGRGRVRGLVGRIGAARPLRDSRLARASRWRRRSPSARARTWPSCSGPAASCWSGWPRTRRGSSTTAGDGESLLLRNLAPAVDLDALLPSFFDRDAATLLLTLTLLAAFALAWRFRLLGLVSRGRPAYILVAGTLRDRPSRRSAPRDRGPRRPLGAGPMGGAHGPAEPAHAGHAPRAAARGPWVLGAGEQRNSRRTGLPPGAYRVELRGVRGQPGTVPDGGLRATRASCSWERPSSPRRNRARSFRCCCPAACVSSASTAIGEAGRSRLDDARVVPEAVVPRQPPRRLSVPAARDRRALSRRRSARARDRRGSERARGGRIPSRRRGGEVPGRRPARRRPCASTSGGRPRRPATSCAGAGAWCPWAPA